MEQMQLNDNVQSNIQNVMTADNYRNIEAALQYVACKGDNLTQIASEQIGKYICTESEKWAQKLNKRMTAQDIVLAVIRSQVLLKQTDISEEIAKDYKRYAVEYPTRIPLMRFGVSDKDEQVCYRMAFLTDMLFDKNNQPLYKTQGLFLANLVNRLMIENNPCNDNTKVVAKIILNSVLRLPEREQQAALKGISAICWPTEMRAYFNAKQTECQSERPRVCEAGYPNKVPMVLER